jgi:predicted CopG family antitoxin
MSAELTTISVTPSARDRIRSLKRGGQSYSELLEAMAEQYQPEEASQR